MQRSNLALVLAILAALCLPACGGDSGGTADSGGTGDSGKTGDGGGGVAAVASPAGTWAIDKPHLKAAMLKLLDEMVAKKIDEVKKQYGIDELPAEAKTQMEAEMKDQRDAMAKQADEVTMEIVMSADGTWTAIGKFGPETKNEKGTWTLDGDQVTIKTTHEDGEKTDDPDMKTATWKGDVMEVSFEEEGMNLELRLLRK